MFESFTHKQGVVLAQIGILLLLIPLVSLLPSMVHAQTPDPAEIAQKLQTAYESASTVTAEFRQTTAMKFSSRIRQGSGTMIFRKPGRMRWDYTAPDNQVLISDGESISMYFEKNRQMIVSSAKEYLQSDVTYSFFAGTGDILKDFDVGQADFANTLDDLLLIKLVPKSSHPHVSAIHAWIASDTYLIKQLQIVDHFDTVTDLYFNNVQIDGEFYSKQRVTDELFLFIPPPDTEIIEQY